MCPSCPAGLGRRAGAAVGIVALRVILVMAMFQTIVANTEHMACPTDCFCLGNMVDCSKKRLKRVPDDLPSWVQILDVSSNGITHIRNDQFKGLNQLEEINLSDNKLTIFNGSVLRHLPAVQNLKLSHNQLTQLPDISWPVNITHLILSHNVISHVNGSSLRNVENLRVIDLSYNVITQLRNATLWTGLSGLHHLFLMDNKIESIDRGALDNLSSLEWLKLNKNRLTSLPPNVFLRLQKLKYLELNQNRLRKIEGLRFQGLGNLVSLRLRRNQLSELMDGAFWGLSRIETLQLDYNNLSKINSGFLFGLETMEHLSMAHNVISQIEADSWSSCKRLVELDLSHNHLSAITESMFWRLETLQTLKLNHNRISYIAETAFRDLLLLKTLDLNHNQLSSTLEDTQSVFSSLTSLTRFSLDGNNIKSIAKHTFKGLHHVKQLNLLSNSITSIQDNAFEPLKDLEQLRFNSSSLLCDCHLSWLPIWLRGTGLQVNVIALCAHPVPIQGQSILEVDGTSFKCDDFPKPIIIKDPLSQIALKDGTLNLTCTAATSSDSQLKIDWKKEHVVLNNALVENTARSSSNDDGLVEYMSHLVLRPVKNEHAGHYQCIVSNALGTSYSAKAEITVGVFPRFLKTPNDVTVKAGSTARLECAASGQPTPEIAWQKDGGDDFPAARERRMHVMPSDDVFFIVEVKSEDQGVYTCTAKNDAGFIKANSTLVVLRTPSFAKTSREKVATEGETAVLECMSSRVGGRPRLDWLKEGQPLFITSRHFFAAEGQLLVIVNAQPSDSGEYTCIMTNSLGSERATSHFTVVGLSSFGDKSYVAESNQSDDMTRVGIIVIAVVVCVVGTSLVWVIVIYRLRLKREEYGSTTTDETTLPGEIPSSPFHANEDGSSITGRHSSPVLWTNAGHSVLATEDYSSVMRGTKRLLSDPTQKCSPSRDFYLYNSCRCHQDSGCFCTNSDKSNEKSSHAHLPEVGNEADGLRKCRLPPVNNCRRHSTVSMPDACKHTNVETSIKDACRSLEVVRHMAGAIPSTGSDCVNTCTGWHTTSDSDLSSTGNQCHLCMNKYPVSCQKSQAHQVAMSCHLPDKLRTGPTFENCGHALVPGAVVSNRSCQSDCLHKQLAEALPVVSPTDH